MKIQLAREKERMILPPMVSGGDSAITRIGMISNRENSKGFGESGKAWLCARKDTTLMGSKHESNQEN